MSEVEMKTLIFFGSASLMGWILLSVGLRTNWDRRNREEMENTRTTGSIVDYVGREARRGRSGTSVYWTPVIEFMADGRKCRFDYAYSLDQKEHPVGETVDVLYDVNDPKHFHLEADEDFNRGGSGAIRLGLIWIFLSAVLTVMLAVFVGGASINFRDLGHGLRRLSSSGEKIEEAQVVTTEDGFQYKLQDDFTAVIKKYKGSAARLTIPLVLDGHIVKSISPGAFAGSMQLTELTVPGSMPSIPMAAFVGCVSLSDVTIEEGVKSIGKQALGAACPALKNVTLPESLTHIADDAFSKDCAAIFHVIPGSVAEKYCLEKGFQVRN